eukprot:UN06621
MKDTDVFDMYRALRGSVNTLVYDICPKSCALRNYSCPSECDERYNCARSVNINDPTSCGEAFGYESHCGYTHRRDLNPETCLSYDVMDLPACMFHCDALNECVGVVYPWDASACCLLSEENLVYSEFFLDKADTWLKTGFERPETPVNEMPVIDRSYCEEPHEDIKGRTFECESLLVFSSNNCDFNLQFIYDDLPRNSYLKDYCPASCENCPIMAAEPTTTTTTTTTKAPITTDKPHITTTEDIYQPGCKENLGWVRRFDTNCVDLYNSVTGEVDHTTKCEP